MRLAKVGIGVVTLVLCASMAAAQGRPLSPRGQTSTQIGGSFNAEGAYSGGKWIDIVTAPPQAILRVRKTTMGYVSQFLRVIPRVPTLDVVSEPLRAIGVEAEEAKDKARDLLTRLNVPEHLWHVAPATFSGGEQQRVNIARGFIFDYPILLLDEPTASLDEENQEAVLGLIFEARDRGAALVGIFHDPGVRKAIGSRHFEMPYSEVA